MSEANDPKDQKALDNLIELLDLEPLEVNIFRGQNPDEDRDRVFGGQVLAQALTAAQRTVEDDRLAHSLHAYFLLGGDPNVPILYDVDRIRDGRSFTTRRVRGIQHGRAIFNMSVSFHKEQPGLEHQVDAPETPKPEDLPTYEERWNSYSEELKELTKSWEETERPIEQRFVERQSYFDKEKAPPYQRLWMKTRGELPDSLALHQCILAYASDFSLLDTSMMPHGVSYLDGNLQTASLDHAMWFHRRFRADEWLLYEQDSPAAAGSRGFNRGSVYTRDGVLVASATQEGLIRITD